MRSVFLSYSRADDEQFVRRLWGDLTKHGFKVWFDRESMPNRGLAFTDEIRRAISEQDRLLLVVGPNANSSEYVQQEWNCALDLDKPVYPIIRVGNEKHLPERLALYDARFMQDDARYERELERLVSQLRTEPPKLGMLYAVPNLPHHLVERPEALRRLREALTADLERAIATTGTAKRIGAHGMGGIGKSVLAAYVARDPKTRRMFPDGIYWVPVGENPGVLALQQDLARALNDSSDFTSEAVGKQRLRELLHDRQALIILDDVWDAIHADSFDVLGPHCRMLVTTRDAALLTTLEGGVYEVQLLSQDDALQLLSWWAEVAPSRIPAEGAQIVTECGRLPLALAICGAMIRDRRPWADVMEDLRDAELEFVRHEIPNYPYKDIWKAIKVGVDALALTRAEYRERFAELAVFTNDEVVPEAAVEVLWEHTGNMKPRRSRDLLRLMASKSLIRLDTGPSDEKAYVSLHDLVHDFATRLAENPQQLHQELLDAYQTKCSDDWWTGPDDGYFFQRLVYHLTQAGRWSQAGQVVTDFSWLMRKSELGQLNSIANDYTLISRQEPKPSCDETAKWQDFFCERAHVLRRGLSDCSAHKILLQVALEDADDSPLTHAAEAWVESGHCDWFRLQRVPRPSTLKKSPCEFVLEGHSDDVLGALLLRDGRVISWSDLNDGSLRLWDMTTGQCQLVFDGHTDEVEGALVLADGRIVSWSDDETLMLWDLESGKCQFVLDGHTSLVRGALQLDDGRILSWSYDETLMLWDSVTGSHLKTLKGHSGSVLGAILLSGNRVLSWSVDTTLKLWDVTADKRIRTFKGHTGSIEGAVLLRDHRVLSWSQDQTLKLWDTGSGKCIGTLLGHRGSVVGAILLEDGRIVSWSDDHALRIWNATTGECLYVLEGHSSGVLGACSSTGDRLLSWSWDGTLRIWDAHSGRCLTICNGQNYGQVNGALILPGDRVLSWFQDSSLRIWDAQSGACSRSLIGHSSEIVGATILPDGRILSWSRDRTLRLWSAAIREEETDVECQIEWVRGTLAIPNGRILSWSTGNSLLRIWDENSGHCQGALEGHGAFVNGALLLPDGRILSWSFDETIRIWDADSQRCLRVLEGHTGSVSTVIALPDGGIVSGSKDCTIRLWDTESGRCLRVFVGHRRRVVGIKALRGGRILSVSDDGTLRVWNTGTGECCGIAEAAHLTLKLGRAVCLSDSRILSWNSGRRILHVWDSDTCQAIGVLEGHTYPVTGAVQLPDDRILSWSGDHEGFLTIGGLKGQEFLLWDSSAFGRFACFEKMDLAESFPDWLHEARSAVYPTSVVGRFFGDENIRTAELRHRNLPNPIVRWSADFECRSSCLTADGTLVVTGDNHVCILKLYYGKRPVSLADVEELIESQLRPCSTFQFPSLSEPDIVALQHYEIDDPF